MVSSFSTHNIHYPMGCSPASSGSESMCIVSLAHAVTILHSQSGLHRRPDCKALFQNPALINTMKATMYCASFVVF